MLNDGQWHGLEEIQEKIQLDKEQIGQIIVFLKRYHFLVVDDAKKKIKLEDAVLTFLDETATS